MGEGIRIGAQRQLFLTDRLIERSERMTRRVRPVVKCPQNPVIAPEEDWEPRGYVHGTVLYDAEEGLYKAWASGVGAPWRRPEDDRRVRVGVHYFTSEDGVCWERPELGLVEVDGRRTNICALTSQSDHPARWPQMYELFGVLKDSADPDPQRRYKMAFLYMTRDYDGPDQDPFHPGSRRALGAAFSPDGVRWTPLAEPVAHATCDGMSHVFQDPLTGRFLLYGRTKHHAPAVLARHGADPHFQRHNWGRAVRRAASEDFIHWTPDDGELVLAADEHDGPGDEIYGTSVFPWEGRYICLVQVFHNYEDACTLDVQLATSEDGFRFERLSDRSPFIPVGGVGAWDRFNNNLSSTMPIRVGDDVRFYYGGRNYLHSGPCRNAGDCRDSGSDAGLRSVSGVGFGSVKIDRFAGMEATFDAGTLVTRPLVLGRGELRVNAEVPFGALDVAVLSDSGERSVRITERDGVDIPTGLLGSEGPARLKFTLRNGWLYSFRTD